MAQKFCTKCGAELKPGLKFCVSCGAPVEPSKNSSSYNGGSNSNQPSKKLLSYIPSLVISIALCCATASLFGLYYSDYIPLIIVCSVILVAFVANIILLSVFARKNQQRTPAYIVALSMSCLAMVVNVTMFSLGTVKYVKKQLQIHTVTVDNGNHGTIHLQYQDYNEYSNSGSTYVYKNESTSFKLSYGSYIDLYINAESDYIISSCSYKDADNNVTYLVSSSDSRYGYFHYFDTRIDMPDNDITITVTYKPAPALD